MSKHCKPCEGGTPPLDLTEIKNHLEPLKNWNLSEDKKSIWKLWLFKNHYQVMSFVNAIAFISHRENHHPDIIMGYNNCHVRYTTHAVHGLSENDFICAAKIEALEE